MIIIIIINYDDTKFLRLFKINDNMKQNKIKLYPECCSLSSVSVFKHVQLASRSRYVWTAGLWLLLDKERLTQPSLKQIIGTSGVERVTVGHLFLFTVFSYELFSLTNVFALRKQPPTHSYSDLTKYFVVHLLWSDETRQQ